MYRKICPFCKGNSYSSSWQGKWMCPYCEADLSEIIPQTACGDVAEEQPEGKVVKLYKYRDNRNKKKINLTNEK